MSQAKQKAKTKPAPASAPVVTQEASRWPVLLLVAVVVVLVVAGVMTARHSGTKSSGTKTKQQQAEALYKKYAPSTATKAVAPTTPVNVSDVDVINFSFTPASIKVAAGTTVTWTNKDGVAHDIVASDGLDGPDSGTLAQGATYSYTYNSPGTFKYHSAVSPSMSGSVTVTP